jgi:hypothetical protein
LKQVIDTTQFKNEINKNTKSIKIKEGGAKNLLDTIDSGI